MIEIRLSVHTHLPPCTRSLRPLYATLPHGSYTTSLRRFSVSTPASTPPRCRLKPALARRSACNAPLHSHVASFSCGHLYRYSVVPLDLLVEVILVCIAHLVTIHQFTPPYAAFIACIIKNADQQVHQKLKVQAPKSAPASLTPSAHADPVIGPFSAVSKPPRALRKIVTCMRGRMVDLVTNCCGYYIL
ncbi:hypothetical protein B0H14DRAFT_3468487 [Mycena olivaceomarginata]|nr:hypothetical protein B0H14DRAFT_3468487 [Mycena olivaceomarginata]